MLHYANIAEEGVLNGGFLFFFKCHSPGEMTRFTVISGAIRSTRAAQINNFTLI